MKKETSVVTVDNKPLARKKKKGFTLIELVVVIAILAVLSVVAVVAYSNIRQDAVNSADNANGAAIVRALNTYNALGGTTTVPAITTAAQVTIDASGAIVLKVDGPPVMDMSVIITADELARIMPGGSSKDGLLTPPASGSTVWTYTKVTP